MEKVEIICKSCRQRLMVPSNLGDITVTCPQCRYRWNVSGLALREIAIQANPSRDFLTSPQAPPQTNLREGILIHNVDQRSPEWHSVRLGIPTASQFHKIITSRGQPSRQSAAYLNTLLAEIASNKPQDGFSGNYWTDRGNELEPEAVSYYEQGMQFKTVKVGFITDYARTMGCSPDRLVGMDGLLEVKCPSIDTHLHYRRKGEIVARYYPQIQGQLLITGREWVDFFSYFPNEPHFRLRVFRDEQFIARLRSLIGDFMRELRKRQQKAQL